ncbi:MULTISPECIES: serine/threonine-protein kinase [Streptacidiphilus]|uniref:non-specific serine/threonine protein kinase n=1 Tax=Streptacidiphilus cavernicola TaxID=3342716 RepID=A0ABV6UUC1_9ACTN|nr:serine/threonine-protein kinase [Streptacidiphilus jeojiense]
MGSTDGASDAHTGGHTGGQADGHAGGHTGGQVGEGRLVAGRYRLLSRLGRGGMGTVWRALDDVLDRQVAVKEVHLRTDHSPEEREQQRARTLREARAVAQLRHPSVVGIHDVVEQDGEPCIVMELVDGDSLGARLAAEGPVPPREAARIGLAVLSALEAVHAKGVLHRDVKPDNVLLERGTGRIVLTDFGIARVDGSSTLTEQGAFLGSPEFTAPERTEGGSAGPESDLWSVGVLLCTMLEGRSPFRRDSMSGVLYAVLYEEILLPASVEPLAPVVAGLLERDPARRLGSAEAVRLLRLFLERGALVASPTAATLGAGPRGLPARRPERAATTVVEVGAVAGPVVGDPPGKQRGGRRRTGVLLATGGVLVAAATAATVVLASTGTPSGVAAPVTPIVSASASSTSSTATGAHTSARPTPSEGSTGSTAANAVPAGFTLRKDPSGLFSLAVPDGWKRSTDDSGRIFYISPDRAYRIGVHPTPVPTEGVLASIKQQDADGPTTNPGFRNSSVTSTSFHGTNEAAFWQWSWDGYSDDAFGARDVKDLCWIEKGRAFDFWVSAPSSRSVQGTTYFATVSQTFQVN